MLRGAPRRRRGEIDGHEQRRGTVYPIDAAATFACAAVLLAGGHLLAGPFAVPELAGARALRAATEAEARA